jgi:hypothetical protein
MDRLEVDKEGSLIFVQVTATTDYYYEVLGFKADGRYNTRFLYSIRKEE